nr:AMP-binding protein [Janibacter cremeus]
MSATFRSQIDSYLDRLGTRQRATWPSGVARELSYPFGEVPLTEYLRRWAHERPEHPVITWHGYDMSYTELDDLSDRVASRLNALGLMPGDKVAVMMPNVPQFIVAFFGILKVGCVHVPINPMFRRQEIRYELEDTGAKVAFLLDDFAEEFERGSKGTRVEVVIATSVEDLLPQGADMPSGAQSNVPPAAGAERLMNVFSEPTGSVPQDPMDIHALAALNYTGGTTGMPKGCKHTQADMLYTAVAGATHVTSLDRNSVTLLYLPIFWIAGEDGFLVTFACGGTVVLQYRYDAYEAAQAIARNGVTAFIGTVDNALEVLEVSKRIDVSLATIETATVMSFVTKLSSDVRERWRLESGSAAILRESSYGLTEDHTMDTFTLGLDDIDLEGRPGFVGLPVPGTDFAIIDFLTEELNPIGVEGQIIVRSPSMMAGYYENEEATSETLRDGWLLTGDSGVIDERGCLHYLGRRKEMLKVNGMSVFPSELEFQLSLHSDIAAAGVIGQPDEAKGEVPVAFVELRHGCDLEAKDIESWCRQNIAPYKVPRVRVIAEMPMAPTGKVMKSELVRYADAIKVSSST